MRKRNLKFTLKGRIWYF